MWRADERALLWCVMIFELVSLLLLAFKGEKVCTFSLKAAVILPAGTYLGYRLLIKYFHADRLLYILCAFLCALGVILLRAVFSESERAAKQLRLLILFLPFLFLGTWLPRVFTGDERIIDFAMLPALGLLGLSFVMGTGSVSRSWAKVGSLPQLQPSELVKPVTVFILAAGFTQKSSFKGLIPYVGFGILECLILFLQPDLGAVFLYFLIILVLFAAGTGKTGLTLAACAAAAVCAALFVFITSRTGSFEYLSKRLDVWRNPWSDEYNSSRQIAQGLMSLASGGVFGAGLGLSGAVRVSVVESDYIFAACAEEYGTLFSLCVLVIYIVICIKGCQTALSARNRFHALIAFGASFLIGAQAALIVAGDLNIIPLTGVTLPFVSAGGSSLISSALLAGLILGVSSVNAEDEYDELMRAAKYKWEAE